MMKTKTGNKPFLKMLMAMDLRHQEADDSAVKITVTYHKGFITSNTNESSSTCTKDLYTEVSGKYGFSKISSVSAKVGGKISSSTTTSTTHASSMKSSVTQSFEMVFPKGKYTGYFQWVLDMNGELLHLDEPYIGLSNPDDIAKLEDAVSAVTITGEEEVESQRAVWRDGSHTSVMEFRGPQIIYIKAWCEDGRRREGLVNVVRTAANMGWRGIKHDFTISHEAKYAYYMPGKKNRQHSNGMTRDNWCDSTGDSNGWGKKHFYDYGILEIKRYFK